MRELLGQRRPTRSRARRRGRSRAGRAGARRAWPSRSSAAAWRVSVRCRARRGRSMDGRAGWPAAPTSRCARRSRSRAAAACRRPRVRRRSGACRRRRPAAPSSARRPDRDHQVDHVGEPAHVAAGALLDLPEPVVGGVEVDEAGVAPRLSASEVSPSAAGNPANESCAVPTPTLLPPAPAAIGPRGAPRARHGRSRCPAADHGQRGECRRQRGDERVRVGAQGELVELAHASARGSRPRPRPRSRRRASSAAATCSTSVATVTPPRKAPSGGPASAKRCAATRSCARSAGSAHRSGPRRGSAARARGRAAAGRRRRCGC